MTTTSKHKIMNHKLFIGLLGLLATVVSCKKTADIVVIVPPPTDAKIQTLSGGPGGSNAANSVFVDMSNGRQDSVARASWDLGFYTGSDFRVVLNHTSGAGVKVTTKTDLAEVNGDDTIGLTLSTNQF